MLTARNPDYVAAVEAYVRAQGFLGLLGVAPTVVAPGVVEFRVPFRADLGQQDGLFHGGVIGAIAEAVMGSAAYSLVDAGANVVGASYSLDLVRPAQGTRLVARGEVVKSGRTLIVCRADVAVEDEAGAAGPPSAIAQGAMAVIAAR